MRGEIRGVGQDLLLTTPLLTLVLIDTRRFRTRGHSARQPEGQLAQGEALTGWVFLRLLGVTYLFAFGALWPQVRGLIGSNGIVPAAQFLQRAEATYGGARYWRVPTLAWIRRDDQFLQGLCGSGIALSLLVILDLVPGPALALLWICYLSLGAIAQPFLGYQWDALLLETGFLAIWPAPWRARPGPPKSGQRLPAMIWPLRWLLFRLMFGSGYVKLASGDATWRGRAALVFHYETQPLPTPLAWYLHQCPRWLHRWSTAVGLALELIVPFGIFGPRPVRLATAQLLAVLQVAIMLTGNYAFFNLLSLVLCLALVDDAAILDALPARLRHVVMLEAGTEGRGRAPYLAQIGLGAALSGLSSAPFIRLALLNMVRQLPPSRFTMQLARIYHHSERLIDSLQPFRLMNTYGLFAVMTTTRPEIVVEGSNDGVTWREYQFRYKPGDVRRRPTWIAPYHPRLDWQMWFAALQAPARPAWFINMLVRLLEGSPDVVRLLDSPSFADAPPRYVRALLYDYRFTDRATARARGSWWRRELLGLYVPPIRLSGASGKEASSGASSIS